ncbi:MAG: hypothetical protein B6D65_00200 [candidate division Zixibacteria bacterium 4484_93]|nr:MAG: hypothetical protein B6D65_00200 [candidate division Zixibacteria bacterium 4484_93]
MLDRAAVIGAGSWGTAFSCHLARCGIAVDLWVMEKELLKILRASRENSLFLPGIILPESIKFSSDINEIISRNKVIFVAIPTQFIRSAFELVSADLRGKFFVSLAKGMERETLLLPTEILRNILGDVSLSALSGPSFAREVALGKPTVLVLASNRVDSALFIRDTISDEHLRVYASGDITGVELCGALKNVIAVAAGVSEGLGFGENTRAALIVRGLAEMARLVEARGGSRQTVYGISGLGDLVLTATSRTSRNFRAGLMFAEGKTADTLSLGGQVAEGVETVKAVVKLASALGIEMPISSEVHRVIYEGKSPEKSVHDLMTRELKFE